MPVEEKADEKLRSVVNDSPLSERASIADLCSERPVASVIVPVMSIVDIRDNKFCESEENEVTISSRSLFKKPLEANSLNVPLSRICELEESASDNTVPL